MQSLPSRGAWIEIFMYSDFLMAVTVAPLAGSVDRNVAQRTSVTTARRRSPRGERG